MAQPVHLQTKQCRDLWVKVKVILSARWLIYTTRGWLADRMAKMMLTGALEFQC